MQYYGTRLSENLSRREPEGYLLCLNVPVARTGTQEYLPEELGLPPVRGDPGRLIPVERPEEEVFDPATIASFEGMPVTNDHPPEGVTLENIRYLQKGHAHHIRRGTGDEADLLLADLIITDPGLIEMILHEGKREISCGYMYELREEDGRYVQRNIRGNHIAVVDSGRAGPRVSIRDEDPIKHVTRTFALPAQRFSFAQRERRETFMKKSLFRKLSRMARDGDQEALEAVTEILENLTEPDGGEAVMPVEAAAPVLTAPDPAQVVVGYPAAGGVSAVAAPVGAAAVVPAAAAGFGPAASASAPAAKVAVPAAPLIAPAPAPVAAPAVSVVPMAEPTAAVTVPEGRELTIDSDLGVAILEKLDQLIALLTPAATDEEVAVVGKHEKQSGELAEEEPSGESLDDPIEEIVEAVTEAVEAGAVAEGAADEELSQSPIWPIAPVLQPSVTGEREAGIQSGKRRSQEPAGEVIADPVAAEVAEVLETLVGPSSVLEPEEEESLTDCDDPEGLHKEATADAIRAALKAVRPALAKLPAKDRAKVCADVAARVRKSIGDRKKAARGTGGVYAALAARGRDRMAEEPNALGKRIMAARNANMKK